MAASESIVITKKERSLIKKKASLQDVNSIENRVDTSDIEGILHQLEIQPSKVKEACCMKFVQNIMPHDDSSYCKSEKINSACLIIVENRPFDIFKHPDTPLGNYFYRDGVFDAIDKDKAYTFNPKKEHALMVNSTVTALVLFLGR